MLILEDVLSDIALMIDFEPIYTFHDLTNLVSCIRSA